MVTKPISFRPLHVILLIVLLCSGLTMPATVNRGIAAGTTHPLAGSPIDASHPGVSLPWERAYGLGNINAAALAPDGQHVAVGSASYYPVVVNLVSGLV